MTRCIAPQRGHLRRIDAWRRIATAATVLLLTCVPAASAQRRGAAAAPALAHARLVVLTDIGNEPDDTQSLIRLLLYANVIDLEGLVATTSIHLRDRLEEHSIRRVIAAYGAVHANLLRHEPGFPSAARLAAITTRGLPAYGMAGVGDGKDSPGSELIIRALRAPDPRPLWVSAWGGPNTLAQALFRIRRDFSAAEAARLIGKLRVYTISDQDDSGPWIRAQFPDLFYIVSPGGYGAATWGGMNVVEDSIRDRDVSNAWLATHIQQGHGPLGALYPDVAYGMEGDTPSFLGLIPNGLHVPERPDYGGWGGRYRLAVPALADMDPQGFTGGVPILPEARPIWTNSVDRYRPHVDNAFGRAVARSTREFMGFRTTVWRWRPAVQADFEARLQWTTRAYAQANHPPVVVLDGPDEIRVRGGELFVLGARGSRDPDGDALRYLWFNYPEAGDLAEEIAVDGAENTASVRVRAPSVRTETRVQFIVQVSDHGSPALTRYGRVRVTITP